MTQYLTEEVIELTNKIAALGADYSNAAMLFAALHIVARQIVAVANTETELAEFSGEIDEALGNAIISYWKQRPV